MRDCSVLNVISWRNRMWWKNLRGGAMVNVYIQGKSLKATGEVIEDYDNVAKQLMEYLKKVPKYARYLKVNLDLEGNPNPEDVALVAKDMVVVLLRLKTRKV